MLQGAFIGIDVSKACLDLAFRPGGETSSVSNDARGIARLIRLCGVPRRSVWCLKPLAASRETNDLKPIDRVIVRMIASQQNWTGCPHGEKLHHRPRRAPLLPNAESGECHKDPKQNTVVG